MHGKTTMTRHVSSNLRCASCWLQVERRQGRRGAPPPQPSPASGGGGRKTALTCLLVLLLHLPLLAHASLSGDINRLRSKGCSRNPGVSASLRASRALDAVAQQ